MSDPGTCIDAVSLGGAGQETEADGDPLYAEPPLPCADGEAQSAAEQPFLGKGMEIGCDQPDACTETLAETLSVGQDADGVPDTGDVTVSQCLSV